MSDPIFDALERYSGVDRDAEEGFRRYKALTAEVAALRVAGTAFVEHHKAGQAGQPDFSRTYGEVEVWQDEWDRRFEALDRALAGQGEREG